MIKKLAKEIVLGGHLLAIGTSSIAASFSLLIGKYPTIDLLIMAYLFSYAAYMMNRSSEFEQDMLSNPSRTEHLISRRRYLPIISLSSFFLGYLLAARVNLIFFIALLIPLLLSIMYSIGLKRLLGKASTDRLKNRLLVKNIVISLGWSLIPFLVSLYYLYFSSLIIFYSLLIFLRLLVNTILFDLRDIDADKRYGIRTIPGTIGANNTLILLDLLDIFIIAYILFVSYYSLLPTYSLTMLLFPAYSIGYRALIKKGMNLSFVCDYIADGEYILYGPVIYLGRVA